MVLETSSLHIRNLLSCFGKLVQKVYFFVFHILLFRHRLNNQMAAVILQMIPSLYPSYSKFSLFISAITYEKFIVSKDYCIAHHDDKICCLPSFRYHILLIGDIEELLQKLDASHTNLWTVFIRFSSINSVTKLL